jgi:hypothetical protein
MRSGGRVVVMDTDCGSLVIHTPDEARMKRVLLQGRANSRHGSPIQSVVGCVFATRRRLPKPCLSRAQAAISYRRDPLQQQNVVQVRGLRKPPSCDLRAYHSASHGGQSGGVVAIGGRVQRLPRLLGWCLSSSIRTGCPMPPSEPVFNRSWPSREGRCAASDAQHPCPCADATRRSRRTRECRGAGSARRASTW